jgi:hypothetical protein
MVVPLRRSAVAVPLPRPSERSGLSIEALLLVTLSVVIAAAVALTPVAYSVGFAHGQETSDQDAVFRATTALLTTNVRLRLLVDSVQKEQGRMRRSAQQRLSAPPTSPRPPSQTLPPPRPAGTDTLHAPGRRPPGSTPAPSPQP